MGRHGGVLVVTGPGGPGQDELLARRATVLGDDVDDPALTATLGLVEASPVAMAYAHGAEHHLLYNDAYAALLGGKHPRAYGRPAAEVFPEVWAQPGVGDAVAHVYATGEPSLEVDAPLTLSGRHEHAADEHDQDPEAPGPEAPNPERDQGSGHAPVTEDRATFTRGMSAVRRADGRVAGILTVAVETTQAVAAIDRLGRLASALSEALTVDDVVRATARHALLDLGVTYFRVAVTDTSGASWVSVRATADDLTDPAVERLPTMWQVVSTAPDGDLDALVGGDAGAVDGEVAPAVLVDWLGARADAVDRHVPHVAMAPVLSRPARAPQADGGHGTTHERSGVKGFLAYGFSERSVSAADRALFAGCAELFGRALRRARVLEHERDAARLLQRSLLPDSLPHDPHLLLAGQFEPGTTGSTVGGDFYDAFAVGDGQVALVIGDAMGRGVLAASLMGQVRSAIRAVAVADPSPERVLDTCSHLLEGLVASSDLLVEGDFVTVTYVLLDPASGQACAASAGHPPPVLLSGTHAQHLQMEAGPPLGVRGRRPVTAFVLEPEDLLLLYTDGLVGRRDEAISHSTQRLLDELEALGPADPLVVSSALLRRYGPGTEDDVALLVASRTQDTFLTARIVLPLDPIAPRLSRRWARAELTGWGVHDRVDDVTTALAEVVTNAVLHARSETEATLRLGGGRLLVTVADTGGHGEAARHAVPETSTRGRGLGIVEQVTDAWGSNRTTSGLRVWFEVETDGAVADHAG